MTVFRGLTVVLIFLNLISPSPSVAAYLPDEMLVRQMAELLKGAPLMVVEEGPAIKQVMVGTPRQPGDVAYFTVVLDPTTARVVETALQLEEWVAVPGGGFRVTFSRMVPQAMIRWQWSYAADGLTVDPRSYSGDIRFAPDSPEAIATSERTQALLKKAGTKI